MKSRRPVEAGPEKAPPFARKVVLDGWRPLGILLVLMVPMLALAKMLGDRIEHRTLRQGNWVMNVEAPACARDGAPLQIIINLSSRDDPGVAELPLRVEISADYLTRFTDVRRLPSVFGQGDASPAAGGPVVIELTPEHFGWARGRLGVTARTGERLELDLKTFVFP
jgi:hypothetical protein